MSSYVPRLCKSVLTYRVGNFPFAQPLEEVADGARASILFDHRVHGLCVDALLCLCHDLGTPATLGVAPKIARQCGVSSVKPARDCGLAARLRAAETVTTGAVPLVDNGHVRLIKSVHSCDPFH